MKLIKTTPHADNCILSHNTWTSAHLLGQDRLYMLHVSFDAFYCRSDYLCWDAAEAPNAVAAAIVFCQMQQLCSVTSVLSWSAASFAHCYYQSASGNDEQYACCVYSAISAPFFYLLQCLALKLHTPSLIYSALTVGLIRCFLYISLWLQAVDLKLPQLFIVSDFLFSISRVRVPFFSLQGNSSMQIVSVLMSMLRN